MPDQQIQDPDAPSLSSPYLSDEDKIAVLKSQGLDPSQYDLVPAESVQQTPPPNPPPVLTAKDAVLRGMRQGIGPTLGAGSLMALGSLIAPEAFLPALAFNAATGLGGSWLGGKAQEEVEKSAMSPENYQKYQQENAQLQQEHPYAMGAGQILDSPLMGFNPSIGNVAKAGSGAANYLRGIPFQSLKPAEKAALLQIPLNTVASAGLNAGSQLANTGTVDPAEVAEQGLGGMLFNKPNVLGKLYGFHAIPDYAENRVAPTRVIKPTPKGIPFDENINSDKYAGLNINQLGDDYQIEPNAAKVDPLENLIKFPGNKESSDINLAPKAEERQPIPFSPLSYSSDYANAQAEKVTQDRVDLNNIDRSISFDPTKYQEAKSDLRAPTPQELALSKQEAANRGISTQEESDIIHPRGGAAAGKLTWDENGNPVAVTDPETRTPDTMYHELGHEFFRQLESSNDPRDVALVQKGKELLGGEEPLAEIFGNKYQEVMEHKSQNPGWGGKFQRWIADVEANFKNKFGSATQDDINRLLVARSRKSAPTNLDPNLAHTIPFAGGVDQYQLAKRAKTPVEQQDAERIKMPETPIHEEVFNTPNEPWPSHPMEKLSNPNSGIGDIAELGSTPAEKEVSIHTSNQFHKMATMVRQERGEAANAVANKLQGINDQDLKLLGNYQYMKFHNKPSEQSEFADIAAKVEANPKLMALDQAMKDYYRAFADKATPFQINKLPNYNPDSWNSASVDTLVNRPPSDSGRKTIIDRMNRHLEEKGIEDADKRSKIIDQQIQSLGAVFGGKSSTDFGALRKSAGYGLPKEDTIQNALENFKHYAYRAGRDLSFHTYVENDPVMRGILNIPDQHGDTSKNAGMLPNGTLIKPNNAVGNSGVLKEFLDTFHRYSSANERTTAAVTRTVNSGMLGPLTGMKNATGTVVHMLPYMPVNEMPHLITALGDIQEAYKHSIERGVNTASNLRSVEQPESIGAEALTTKIGNTADKLTDALNKFQLRQSIESMARAYAQANGEHLALGTITSQPGHNKTTERFMRDFGWGYENLRGMPINEIPDQAIHEMGARFVEHVSGYNDQRGLPNWAIKGPWAPFVTLTRWSLEKMNTTYRDVYKPLVNEHDLAPILKYTLGAMLGGSAIRWIYENLNKTIQDIPTLDEAQSMKSWDAGIYSMVHAVNLAGYFGMAGDTVGSVFNMIHGNHGSDIFTYPAADFLMNNIGSGLLDYQMAIKNGNDIGPTTARFLSNTMADTFQMWRILANNTYRQDDVKLANQERNLKVFENMKGFPVKPAGGEDSNYLEGYAQKQFGAADTLAKSMPWLEGAVDYAIAKAGGDLTIAYKNLQELGKGRGKVIPGQNSEAEINELDSYKKFIIQTQGADAWDKLLNDSMTKKFSTDPQKQALVWQFLGSHPSRFDEQLKKSNWRLPDQ